MINIHTEEIRMPKLLLGTLLAGLVVGCAIEEQESSGVLVDQNSDTEIPDWVTAADIDLNKDGIINIQDLVIASKFFWARSNCR